MLVYVPTSHRLGKASGCKILKFAIFAGFAEEERKSTEEIEHVGTWMQICMMCFKQDKVRRAKKNDYQTSIQKQPKRRKRRPLVGMRKALFPDPAEVANQ